MHEQSPLTDHLITFFQRPKTNLDPYHNFYCVVFCIPKMNQPIFENIYNFEHDCMKHEGPPQWLSPQTSLYLFLNELQIESLLMGFKKVCLVIVVWWIFFIIRLSHRIGYPIDSQDVKWNTISINSQPCLLTSLCSSLIQDAEPALPASHRISSLDYIARPTITTTIFNAPHNRDRCAWGLWNSSSRSWHFSRLKDYLNWRKEIWVLLCCTNVEVLRIDEKKLLVVNCW